MMALSLITTLTVPTKFTLFPLLHIYKRLQMKIYSLIFHSLFFHLFRICAFYPSLFVDSVNKKQKKKRSVFLSSLLHKRWNWNNCFMKRWRVLFSLLLLFERENIRRFERLFFAKERILFVKLFRYYHFDQIALLCMTTTSSIEWWKLSALKNLRSLCLHLSSA